MRMGDMMTRDVPLLRPDDTLEQGVKLLRKTNWKGFQWWMHGAPWSEYLPRPT